MEKGEFSFAVFERGKLKEMLYGSNSEYVFTDDCPSGESEAYPSSFLEGCVTVSIPLPLAEPSVSHCSFQTSRNGAGGPP